ncbi:MAG: hypothetical protein H6807_01295 [Planctomycetes bacterium]|nr:hypothetical protein [Planctomycetota bacterium]
MRPSLTSLCLTLVLALAVAAPAQEAAATVADFLKRARPLRQDDACARLLVLRREHPRLIRPIIVLGEQARALAAAEPRSTARIDELATALADCGETLIDRPRPAIVELDALLAAGATDDDRLLLLALDRALHLRIADTVIRRFEDRGAFAGMYRDLHGQDPRLARAYMDKFLDRLESLGHRGHAAQAVAELAGPDQREAFAAEAARVLAQEDENDEVRRGALVLMKRLGRGQEFDAAVAAELAVVREENAKERGKRSIARLLVALENLVDLNGRAGIDAEALRLDRDYCGLLLRECSFETQSGEARAGIAGALYDFSCRLSRAAALPAAEYVLELALAWGYSGFDWLASDPDLANLRGREGFGERIAAWRADRRPEAATRFTPERFDAVVGRGVDEALKKMAAGAARGNDDKEKDHEDD